MKFTPTLTSIDSGETGQKVKGHAGEIEQGSTGGQDLRRILIIAGSGGGIGVGIGTGWD